MRVSTTTLESFRLFLQPEQEWMSEADLIASIKGETVATARMRLGSALQSVLERPEAYRVDGGGYRHEDWFLPEDVVQAALRAFDRRGVWEVKATKVYGQCTVVARADQLIGTTIVENKATLSAFDFDKYAKGVQWRFYLDIFEAAKVTYNVFCLSEPADGPLTLRDTHSFDLYPYAALREDCGALVQEFAAFVAARGLDEFLRDRQRSAA
jgi:hypothetical protein